MLTDVVHLGQTSGNLTPGGWFTVSILKAQYNLEKDFQATFNPIQLHNKAYDVTNVGARGAVGSRPGARVGWRPAQTLEISSRDRSAVVGLHRARMDRHTQTFVTTFAPLEEVT